MRLHSTPKILVTLMFAAVVSVLMGGTAAAQSQFPPPAGPVTICGSQASPTATSYQVSFDGAAATAVTLTAPAVAACPVGSTHSFTLPAASFTVGTHTVRLTAVNAFGSTVGPAYTIVVGIAPGPFTVTAVVGG